MNHHSVLNRSEFDTNVINYTHFLYWGEKVVGLEDGQDVTFQVRKVTMRKVLFSTIIPH